MVKSRLVTWAATPLHSKLSCLASWLLILVAGSSLFLSLSVRAQASGPGVYFVDAKSGPWDISTNPSYPYGVLGDEHLAPTVIKDLRLLRSLVTIQYLSGTAYANAVITGNGAEGSPSSINVPPCKDAPGCYSGSTTRLVQLLAVFADAEGKIIGGPFPVTNAPITARAPPRARQLFLGFNDGYYQDNAGGVSVRVSEADGGNELVFRTFIPFEVVPGPGVITAPIINGIPSKIAGTLAAATASADGQTCGKWPAVQPLYYRGDNRKLFQDTDFFRGEVRAYVGFDPSLYPTGEAKPPLKRSGISVSQAPDSLAAGGTSLIPAAYEDALLNDCSLTVRFGQQNPELMHVFANRESADVIYFNFVGSYPNPLVLSSSVLGDIKWNFKVRLDSRNKTYQILGDTSCYPAFELELDGFPLWGFEPSDSNITTLLQCLGPKVLPSNKIEVPITDLPI
jgi:hypothetical protein